MLTELENKYAEAWEASFNAANPFHKIAFQDDDVIHMRAGIAAACAPMLERIAALETEVEFLSGMQGTQSRREAKLAQRVPDEAIRSALGYIAAYDPEELDAMPKGRLLQRTRAIINVARNTLSAAPAAPEQQEPIKWTPEQKDRLRTALGEVFGFDGTQAPNAQQAETTLKPMTAHRAAYFMERFLREEKLLGPNEQAALRFTISALKSMYAQQATCRSANLAAKPPARPDDTCPLVECRATGGCAMAAQQAEAQQPCAHIEVKRSKGGVELTYGPEPAGFNLPDGLHQLYTAQPKAVPLTELQRLSMEELEEIFHCGGDVYTNVQSALAAKNGMELADAPAEKGAQT